MKTRFSSSALTALSARGFVEVSPGVFQQGAVKQANQSTPSTLDVFESRGFIETTPGILNRITHTNTEFAIQALPVKKQKLDRGILERRFLDLFRQIGGDVDSLEREYRFAQPRRWRADFYHKATRTLIEIEGGIYGRGKHNHADGYTKDAQKYNMATALGFRLFRFTSKLLTPADMLQLCGWLSSPYQLTSGTDQALAFSLPSPQ